MVERRTNEDRRSDNQKQSISMAIMATDIGYIKKSIEGIESQMEAMKNVFVKKEDMVPIEKDHEARLRRLETWGFVSIGALAVVEFLLNYFK